MDYRKKFFAGLALVLILAVACAAVLFCQSGIRQDRYRSAVLAANQSFEAGEYQNAIVEYENAIAIDERQESAYLNLATVYRRMGDYEMAQKTLERGVSYTKSETMRAHIEELRLLVSAQSVDTEPQPLSAEEVREASREVSLENNVFAMVSEYTYTEYFRDYGKPESSERADAGTVLDYQKHGFSAVYYDLPTEKVLDGSGSPVATAKPNAVCFDSLRSVFSEKSEKFAVSYEKLKEIFKEQLSFEKDEASGRWYISAEYKNCRLSVETDENGNIISETAWNELSPLNRSRFEEDENVEGEIQGYIQDAMDGTGMKASIKIRQRGKKAGDVLEELQSDVDGAYRYGGLGGIYTMEVSAQGYVTEYVDVEVVKGQVKTGRNVVLSPEVMEGEIRIVLTWGSSPSDLDSYAIGTSAAGQSFVISFTNTRVPEVGNLDVDDMNGYGPETITITDMGAQFEYSVMDYRVEGTMPGSGAVVKVYLPGKTAEEYSVPSGEGVYWKVFRYRDGKLEKINRLYREDEIDTRHARKAG